MKDAECLHSNLLVMWNIWPAVYELQETKKKPAIKKEKKEKEKGGGEELKMGKSDFLLSVVGAWLNFFFPLGLLTRQVFEAAPAG
jgi:hypothetical protein